MVVRNLFRAGLAGLLFFYGSHSVSAQEKELPSKLFVNTDESYRYIHVKSEKQGVREVRDLCRQSAIEENWIYIPEKKEWHEVGIDEVVYDGKEEIDANRFLSVGIEEGRQIQWTGVTVEINYAKELARVNDELINYHFHPSRKVQGVEDGMILVPSPNDISCMISLARECRSANPKVRLSSKICNELGVVEYRLTERGYERFKEEDGVEYGERKFADASKKIHSKETKEVIEGLSDEFMIFSFTPYEELFEKQFVMKR